MYAGSLEEVIGNTRAKAAWGQTMTRIGISKSQAGCRGPDFILIIDADSPAIVQAIVYGSSRSVGKVAAATDLVRICDEAAT